MPFPIAQVHLKENPDQKYQLYRTDNGLGIRRIPDVDMEMSGNNLEVNISLDATEEDEVFEIVNKRLRREGMDELSEDQKTQLENMMEKERIEQPTVKRRMRSEENDFLRGFIKIAYEFGHLWIDGYQRDTEAEKLRQFLNHLGEIKEESLSMKSLSSDYEILIRFTFGEDEAFEREVISDTLLHEYSDHSHVIWIIPLNKPENGTYVMVNLFGMFTGAVRVSQKAYPEIRLFANDPTDRRHKFLDLREIAEKLSISQD